MQEQATASSLHPLATALAAEPVSDVRPNGDGEPLASLSSLATSVAADLSNLLAPILMAAGLLGERLRDGHDRAALAMVEESARRGEALMHQILALSSGQDRRARQVRPAQLLEDVRRLVAETFPRSIDVVVEAGADAMVLRAEPSELHQVLMTFCMDAQESMPAGGRLTLKSETTEARWGAAEISEDALRNARSGRFVVLTVSDTGVGTKTPLPNRLPQRPASVAVQARADADRIVQSYSGFVDVTNEAGRGTTVRIHLPAMAAGSTQHEVRPPAPPRGRDELVLVMDDEASVRSITEQVLRAFGYRVVTATSGAEAVTMYARHGHEIAAVLLDMVMPVTDGASTIRALRTVAADVQIIAASASAGGGPAFAAVAPSVAAFLPKPYTSAALLHIVRAVLDRRRADAGA
jgi:CheY-like chemotaxis protein